MSRVKLALLRRACSDRGGRPCLHRSAKVKGWRGFAARRAMSPSVTVAVWMRRAAVFEPRNVPLCLPAARTISIPGTMESKGTSECCARPNASSQSEACSRLVCSHQCAEHVTALALTRSPTFGSDGLFHRHGSFSTRTSRALAPTARAIVCSIFIAVGRWLPSFFTHWPGWRASIASAVARHRLRRVATSSSHAL